MATGYDLFLLWKFFGTSGDEKLDAIFQERVDAYEKENHDTPD